MIGVHTPEFAFEKDLEQRASRAEGDGVAIRSRSTTTTRSGTRSGTSTGRRSTSSTRRATSAITDSARASTTSRSASSSSCLPKRAAATSNRTRLVQRAAAPGSRPTGTHAAPETYIGHARGGLRVAGRPGSGRARDYTVPREIATNEWALGGRWTVGEEDVREQAGGRDRVPLPGPRPPPRARSAARAVPVRFRVHLDGGLPGTRTAPTSTRTATARSRNSACTS